MLWVWAQTQARADLPRWDKILTPSKCLSFLCICHTNPTKSLCRPPAFVAQIKGFISLLSLSQDLLSQPLAPESVSLLLCGYFFPAGTLESGHILAQC